MDSFEAVGPDQVLSGRSDWVDDDLLEALVRYPRECVDTEFPHFVRSVDSPDGVDRPSERHPVFYGCFDWHSAVHGHWCLVRQLRLFDDHPERSAVVKRIDARFTAENVAREVEVFEESESFEKPYGWAWLLRLAAELRRWADENEGGDGRADEWRAVLRPLEDRIVELVAEEFLSQSRPFRVGTHGNTAFALGCVLDYAAVTGRDALASGAADTTREFFADDEDYPVEYEPLGWDFLSPALTEADLMRRVYDGSEFEAWLDGFLPDVTAPPYDALLDPVEAGADAEGGVELHLVGLNLSKAWCMAGVADALGDHRHAEPLERSAQRHAERGLERAFTGDYAGSHWLSSFVLYLLTRNEGAIAPTAPN